jgi:hypothetical protein
VKGSASYNNNKNDPDLYAHLHIHEKYVYVTLNTYVHHISLMLKVWQFDVHTIDRELLMVQVDRILWKENHQVNVLIDD